MTTKIIDLIAFESLKEMVGDDFIPEMIETYLEDATELLAQLGQAHSTGDAVAFRRAAHSLKSTSATMGALAFSELVRELETIGQGDRLAEAASLMDRLPGEHEAVAQALKEMV